LNGKNGDENEKKADLKNHKVKIQKTFSLVLMFARKKGFSFCLLN